MIIILKNNKIIGVDKKLLIDLNIELNNISNFINILDLKINELQKEPIIINEKYYNVTKKDIISLENIEIYELKEIEKPDDLDILLTQQHQIIEESKFEAPYIQIEEPSNPDNLDISLIQQPKVSEEIEISFDNELEEIREFLSNNKEFENLIHKELQKASEELGIEYEQLIEFYNQLIEQIKEEKEYIHQYISQKNYENLHKSYHKLKGAALNLRLSHLASILKKLDELSKSKEDIEIIANITNDFYKIIEQKQTKEKNIKKEQINDTILKVIQNYLTNQNEKDFQKDKKHIEKLLNTKLSSLEDLKKIIKE